MRLFTSLLTLMTLVSFSSAQDAAPLSIAFVRSGQVLAAHPAGKAAETLTQQARTELEGIAVALQPLQVKANSGTALTPEEQDQLELTQRTIQETQQRYQQEIEAAAKPATDEINAIIQRLAKENGYSLVLNFEVAQTSNLVLYANDNVPDITEEIIAEIQVANPGAAGEGEGAN